jgi:hypothetical protein
MSSQLPENFSERLVAQQETDESLRRRYEQQLDSKFERPMKGSERFKHVVNLIACVVFIPCFFYATVVRTDFTPTKRSIGAVMVVVTVAWGALELQRLRRGTVNVRFDRRAKHWIAIACMIASGFLVLQVGAKSLDPFHTIILLLKLLLFGVIVCAIQMRTLIAELKVRNEEQCLELQYRIAQLSDQIKKP